ncbi:putative WRKY transcription factor [Trifolium repens]|nr:putative WRKY transcription factor [Trifolium repens]
MENNWGFSSIAHSCNPSNFCETPPQNLTTTITNNNSIISSINTTPSCFDNYIFNQESSSAAHTMENDWDLSSIVRRCKLTTFTNSSTFCDTPPQNLTTNVTTTTTNSLVSPINTTPSCFPDFNFNQENSSVSFTQLKPNDFTDLNKLRVNFNSITPFPTTNIPITVTTTSSALTTTTFSTHITPNTSTITTMPTSTITTPTTINNATIIPTTTTTTFTNQTTNISTHTTTNTHMPPPKPQSRIRKSKNPVTSVCHVKEEKLLEDEWRWKKYGRKSIKGSPHSRSYYKCSSFKDCPARLQFEKSETEENTYVVTYRGNHDHQKPDVKRKSNNGNSRNKSSEAKLPVVGQAGSSQNFKNLGDPNVVMVQFDQSESNNAQVIDGHSTITNPEIELNESQSHVVREGESSQNDQKLDSHNKMMLQHDQPERRNAPIFLGDPYSEIDSSNDNDDILIPNMSAMVEDFLLDINHINGGSILP